MGSLKNWHRKGAERFMVNTLPDSWACLAILITVEGLTVRGKPYINRGHPASKYSVQEGTTLSCSIVIHLGNTWHLACLIAEVCTVCFFFFKTNIVTCIRAFLLLWYIISMKHLTDLMLSQLSLTAAFDLTLCIITSSDWNWSGVIEEQSELTTLGFVHYEDVMQFTYCSCFLFTTLGQ